MNIRNSSTIALPVLVALLRRYLKVRG